MKTKALLISTLCLLGANYSWAADEDVTPGHLKFADQAVGSYEFVHYSSQGANPVSPYPTEKDRKSTRLNSSHPSSSRMPSSA